MRETQKIAVITGDLVKSTQLGPEKVERAFAALEDCAETLADWHGAPLHFTRHRGDGWQVVLAKPKMALRSALTFRAALRALGAEFDSYMGIGEGEVETEIGPDLNSETHSVFAYSGALLVTAKSMPFSNIATKLEGTPFAATVLASEISKGWTPVQASTILPFFSPEKILNQTDVAKALGKSRQAVAKSLEAASFAPIAVALTSIESRHD